MPPKASGKGKCRAEDVEATASKTTKTSTKSKAGRKPKKGNALTAPSPPTPMDWFEGSGSGALFFALDPTNDCDTVSMFGCSDFASLGACATVCQLTKKMVVHHPMWRQLYREISGKGLEGYDFVPDRWDIGNTWGSHCGNICSLSWR